MTPSSPLSLALRPLAAALALSIGLILSAREPADDTNLPKFSPEPFDGYMMPQVKERMKAVALHSVEGIWQFMPEGTTVAVERTDAEGIYSIVAIESDCREVLPGTLLGKIRAGGDPATFDLQLYSIIDDGRPAMPRRFTLRLDTDNQRMEFMRHRSSIHINLWHFVPFLWRHSIRFMPDSKNYYPGAARLYPAPRVPVHQRPL